MVIPEKIGRHALSRSGDVITIRYDGPITLTDVTTLREVFREVYRETGCCYAMTDMSKSTGIEPAARKYMSDWSKEGITETVEGTAVYGVKFAMRAIITLTLNAIRFLSNDQPINLVFVKDEAAARAWVDEQRALKLAKTRPVEP